MAEYLEREALIADIEKRYCKPCEAEGKDYNHIRCRACWVDDMVGEIGDFPHTDVAPVRHARWEIIQREGCFDWCCCSNCGEIDKRQRGIQTPYCWHCGAKMAEEKMDCVSDFWR